MHDINTIIAMENLINRCRRLLNLTQTDHVREIINHINWNCRLIAIRGAKGVGKTTLMLQYLKLHGCDFKTTLYASADSAYFTRHTLLDFANEFYRKGGKHLFLDEVHKYAGWSNEVKEIYDEYPDMKVVLSGSSLLSLRNGEADLSRRCIPYDMQGFSFREYLGIVHGIPFPQVTLADLLSNPNDLCERVSGVCRPLSFFNDYMHEGYYPFILEGQEEYPVRIENVVNYIIDVELPLLCGIEVSNIRKLKALMSVLSGSVPMQVDMQKLSSSIGISRVTLLGYLQHLSNAKLINLLYSSEDNMKKLQKPDKIFIENPNMAASLSLNGVNAGTMRECFMVNQLRQSHRVEYSRAGDLLVDKRYTIEIGGKSKDGHQIAGIPNSYIAADDIEYAYGNKIPLWAFGFLY